MHNPWRSSFNLTSRKHEFHFTLTWCKILSEVLSPLKAKYHFVLLIWVLLRWTRSLPFFAVKIFGDLPNEHRIAWQEVRDEGTYIGLLHFLYENVIPPPHFLVHALYGPQGPQLPSTGFSLRFFTHWPLMHHYDLKINTNVKFLSISITRVLSNSHESRLLFVTQHLLKVFNIARMEVRRETCCASKKRRELQ